MKVIEYRYQNNRLGIFHGIVKYNNGDFANWYFVKVFENTINWHEPIGLINENECTIKTFTSQDYPEYFI